MTTPETKILPPPLAYEGEHLTPELVSPLDRFRLGGDEFAICQSINLAPDDEGNDPSTKLILIDVGFRRSSDGSYGPYDIDGSGQKRTFRKPYVLVNQVHQPDGPQTLTYEFDADERVIIGRDSVAAPTAIPLQLTRDREVSRRHARLVVDDSGNVTTQDLKSSNGTKVKSASELLGTSGVKFGYTVNISDFVHGAGRQPNKDQKGWGFGEYQGRRIIARDTPINGGVYPVGGNGEALVIDDKKYPEELNQVYKEVTQLLNSDSPKRISLGAMSRLVGMRRGQTGKEVTANNSLNRVFEVVSKTLRYDIAATDALAGNYQKIALNDYINEGVGVCRTQATLSAYIIERLIGDGKLSGRVSIDRNHDTDVAGGHAWARYTDETGEVFIIDPAQKYVGPLRDATTENRWAYSRTEDYMKQLLAA